MKIEYLIELETIDETDSQSNKIWNYIDHGGPMHSTNAYDSVI